MLLLSIFTLAQAITDYPRVNIQQFDSRVGSAGIEGNALGTTDQQGYYQSCSLFVVTESEDASPKLGV